jgi:hypothetical protein
MGRRTAPSFGEYLSAFPPKFLHACPDRAKVVGGTWPDALAAQLLHAGADRRKIVGGAGWGHVSLRFLVILC